MDWFKGKSTGNHRFSHEIWGFPVMFPINQSIELGSRDYKVDVEKNPWFPEEKLSRLIEDTKKKVTSDQGHGQDTLNKKRH